MAGLLSHNYVIFNTWQLSCHLFVIFWPEEFEDWIDSWLLIVKIWMQVARGMEYLASMKVSFEVPPVTEVPLVPDEVTGERHVFKILRLEH